MSPATTARRLSIQSTRSFGSIPGNASIPTGSRSPGLKTVPGKAYEPDGWEIWTPLNKLYQAGDYEAVIAQGRELIESSPYGLPLYNLACCEALAGRKTDAIEHLRVAIDRRENLREFAKGDSDLDAIRDEPAFKELVGA